MTARIVDQPLRPGRAHRLWEFHRRLFGQWLVSVDVPIQGTVVVAPIVDCKVHQIIIVFLEWPFIQNQEAPRKSKHRRRGFPSRRSKLGSVNCKLCQRKEPASVANHGLRRNVQRHCWISPLLGHKDQPGSHIRAFSSFSGLEGSANIRRDAVPQSM